jgi:hypothetical protein
MFYLKSSINYFSFPYIQHMSQVFKKTIYPKIRKDIDLKTLKYEDINLDPVEAELYSDYYVEYIQHELVSILKNDYKILIKQNDLSYVDIQEALRQEYIDFTYEDTKLSATRFNKMATDLRRFGQGEISLNPFNYEEEMIKYPKQEQNNIVWEIVNNVIKTLVRLIRLQVTKKMYYIEKMNEPYKKKINKKLYQGKVVVRYDENEKFWGKDHTEVTKNWVKMMPQFNNYKGKKYY